MAKLSINTGIVPNDGLGDSLLSGAVKINSNFDEIYTYLGDGTNLTSTTNGTITNLTGTAGTYTNFNITNGTVTNLTGTAGTYTNFNITNGTVTNLTGTAGTYTNFNITNGTVTNFITTNLVGVALSVGGISTFTNGPMLIGAATSTGTISQLLQVTGGAYVSNNLGIGTTNPEYTLDVNGDINFEGFIYQNGDILDSSKWSVETGDDIYRLNGNVGIGTTNPEYTLDVNGDINFEGFIYQNGDILDSSKWSVETGDDIYRLNGNVGIGTTNPNSKLSIVGNISVVGMITCTDVNSTSDINLKENIQQITNPIEKILQINGYTFNWIKDQRPSIGVIAQELEEILPELVSENNQYKSVNYNGIIALLIEGMKTQQQEINMLKEKLQ